MRAELPDGWSGMTISEYSQGDQYSSESGEGLRGLVKAWSCLISVSAAGRVPRGRETAGDAGVEALGARVRSSFSSLVLKWPGGKRRSWTEAPLAWLYEGAATGGWWDWSVG